MYQGALEAAKAAKDGADECSQILYFADKDSLLKAMKEQRDALLPKGCTILVKASHGMAFAEVVEYLKIIAQ
jgi:UDP-N-acetylmuramyl pentapeptide synthase